MPIEIVDIAYVLGGLVLLAWSADRFVGGASSTARYLGMPPLTIGLIIVGLGTSAPEFVVSASAALDGNPGLAIGNAIGSNISNIGLVLGGTSLLFPLIVQSRILRREVPMLVAATLLALMLCIDQNLSRWDGVILLIATVVITYWLLNLSQKQPAGGPDPLNEEYSAEAPTYGSLKTSLIWLVIGLLTLVGASQLLTEGASNIAKTLGVSDLVIGLTIVAVGTSLPELAASVAGAAKKEYDLVIGNVIGSNIFNTLAVLGIAGVISPGKMPAEAMTRDFPLMAILTLILFAMAYGFGDQGQIKRVEGAILLASFLGYQVFVYMATVA